MKFLILDTCYDRFLERVEHEAPAPDSRPFAEQRRALLAHGFGTADFFSRNLTALGHEAEELVVNSPRLQAAWAAENGVRTRDPFAIVEHQVRRLKPDVLHVQDLVWTGAGLLRRLRDSVKLITGQASYPLPPGFDAGPYDLLFTPLPSFLSLFRRRGIPAALLRLAFEPALLERIGPVERSRDAVFVGGFAGPQHAPSVPMLEAVARKVPIDVWGYGEESLAPDSPLRTRFHGEAWGLEMLRALASGKVVLNRHGIVAGRHAANLRLYEGTGAGALLLTDEKEDLRDLFDVGREVVAYRGAEDCAEKLRWLLDHDAEREAIARAGQARTLRDHTYRRRMEELVAEVERHFSRPRIADAVRRLPGTPPAEKSRVRRMLARLPGAARVARLLARRQSSPEGPDEALFRLYQGLPVPHLEDIAAALAATGESRGSILVIGSVPPEALEYLLGHPVQFHSAAPEAALPDGPFDVVLVAEGDRERLRAHAARAARRAIVVSRPEARDLGALLEKDGFETVLATDTIWAGRKP